MWEGRRRRQRRRGNTSAEAYAPVETSATGPSPAFTAASSRRPRRGRCLCFPATPTTDASRAPLVDTRCPGLKEEDRRAEVSGAHSWHARAAHCIGCACADVQLCMCASDAEKPLAWFACAARVKRAHGWRCRQGDNLKIRGRSSTRHRILVELDEWCMNYKYELLEVPSYEYHRYLVRRDSLYKY